MTIDKFLESNDHIMGHARCLCDVTNCHLEDGNDDCNWFDKDTCWYVEVLPDGTAVTWCVD